VSEQLTNRLIEKIQQKNALQRGFLIFARENLRPEEIHEFDRYIEHCLAEGRDLDFLADCYHVIVNDTFKEQVYFRRHQRYRYTTYEEVEKVTYQNPQYMTAYMHGLAITSWLWPNHVAIHRWFIEKLPKDHPGSYLEIGPGPGHFIRGAIDLSSYSEFLGVDISPTSAALTRAMLSGRPTKPGRDWRIEITDFLAFDPGRRFDAIVMGEVLEHVSQPAPFLEKIRHLSKPDAFIFITTAINAPAIDHIYLFPDAASVEDLARRAGLEVRETLLLPYHGTTMEQTMTDKLPVNIALILSHPNGSRS
jgi:2-polyprenyl-3-methyl-5-hydroxy-6-metoxy-1,4-benzoquinol methylase